MLRYPFIIIIPSLRFPAPLFAITLRVRLGLAHPCLASYEKCACGDPLDSLGTHLMLCGRGVFFSPGPEPGPGLSSDPPRATMVEGGTKLILCKHMECGAHAARTDLVAATEAEKCKERRYRDRTSGKKFVPFALETYGALSARSGGLLVECASLASGGCTGSGPSTGMLCTWFQKRVSIALQRSLAHSIHAGFLRLEESMALLTPPPSRAPLSSSELHVVTSLSYAFSTVLGVGIFYRHIFVLRWSPHHFFRV